MLAIRIRGAIEKKKKICRNTNTISSCVNQHCASAYGIALAVTIFSLVHLQHRN